MKINTFLGYALAAVCAILIYFIVSYYVGQRFNQMEGFDTLTDSLATKQTEIDRKITKSTEIVNQIETLQRQGNESNEDFYTALYTNFDDIIQLCKDQKNLINDEINTLKTQLTTQKTAVTAAANTSDVANKQKDVFLTQEQLARDYSLLVISNMIMIQQYNNIIHNKLLNINDFKYKNKLQKWMTNPDNSKTTAENVNNYKKTGIHPIYEIIDTVYIEMINDNLLNIWKDVKDTMKLYNVTVLPTPSALTVNQVITDKIIKTAFCNKISLMYYRQTSLMEYGDHVVVKETSDSIKSRITTINQNLSDEKNGIRTFNDSLPVGEKMTTQALYEAISQNCDVVGGYADSSGNIYYSPGRTDIQYHSSPSFTPGPSNDDISVDYMQFAPGSSINGVSSDLYGPSFPDSPQTLGDVFIGPAPANSLTTSVITNVPFDPTHAGGFCSTIPNDSMALEEKCNALSPDVCASTSCCVLLGGQKCVAGSQQGPNLQRSFSDPTFAGVRKDFYYYNGKCFGNCGNNRASVWPPNTSGPIIDFSSYVISLDSSGNRTGLPVSGSSVSGSSVSDSSVSGSFVSGSFVSGSSVSDSSGNRLI